MGYLLFAGIPFVVSEAFSASVTQLSPERRVAGNVSDLPFCSVPALFSPLSASSATGLCALISLFARNGWRFLFFGGNAAIEMRRRAPSFILSPEKQLKVSWPQSAATGPFMGSLPSGRMASSWSTGFFCSWDFGTEPFDAPALGAGHERHLRYGSPRPGSRGRRTAPRRHSGKGCRDPRLCGQVLQFQGKGRRAAPLRSLPGTLRLCA